MTYYLIHTLTIIAALGLFGLMGGFVVIPFRNKLIFPLFLAPHLGILVAIVGTATLYAFLNTTIATAFNLTVIGTIFLTIFSCIYNKLSFKQISRYIPLFILSVILIAFINYICNTASILNQAFSLTFLDGTDQIGYSQVADWVTLHPHELPVGNPEHYYQSWIDLMFTGDPRFGSYYFLAIIAHLFHTDGMFAFDIACAIFLSAMTMSLSGLFSRSRAAFIILCIALTTSLFYALCKAGFFGKLLFFPSIFLFLGLFSIAEAFSRWQVLFLACIAAACASVYPAPVSCLLFTLFYAIYVSATVILNSKDNSPIVFLVRQKFVLFLLLLAIIIFTTGILATGKGLSVVLGTGDTYFQDIHWLQLIMGYIGPDRNADSFIYTGFKHTLRYTCSGLMLIVMFILPIMALCKRNITAFAFSFLAIACALLFITLGKKWSFYQFTGIAYPLAVIGAIILYDDSKKLSTRLSLLCMLALMIFITSLSLKGALRLYANYNERPTFKFSEKEINHLQNLLQGKSVTIDIIKMMKELTNKKGEKTIIDPKNEGSYALPLMTELGKIPNIDVHWTPSSWNYIVDYRHWPVPKQEKTDYLLRVTVDIRPYPANCTKVYQTKQYVLFKC